ncbi:MAG: PDZ domain-containing protein [Gemmataceae bacterium]|nr:PDZ domain-containing protein [Gemmataceae bacterium]
MAEQLARLDDRIADLARRFVRLRVENMRGIDLNVFDFDYDLTWTALLLDADGKALGRYGGRDPTDATKSLSTAGLRHALSAALEAHRGRAPAGKSSPRGAPRTVEQYPAIQRVAPRACVHCHNVPEFRREALQSAGTWDRDEVWVYPLPENVGLTLDVDRGDRVRAVAPRSAAERAGLTAGDTLLTLNELPIASIADVQYALHRAPARGSVPVRWERAGKAHSGQLELGEGWRKTDVSWRWSLRSLPPDPCVHGDDLRAEERKALGLGPRQLALRQGPFVTPPARHAGVQTGDVIVGVDGRDLDMTARQFGTHVRLTYRPGDRIVLNVLRGGKRLELPLQLPGR